MRAVILCGGRGSRLGSVTDKIPKPLVEVRGNPIIWYTFLNLYHHGFREFIFPLGYRGDMIQKYVQQHFGQLEGKLYFKYTGEDTPIAGRIEQIKHKIPEHGDFFLVNGDTLFDFDIKEMYDLHKREKALVTLSSVGVVAPWGLIQLVGDKVVGFDRERKIRHIEGDYGFYHCVINSGLAWINKEALDLIDFKTDFETSLYRAVSEKERCSHYEIKGMWFPIDTQKDLETINMEVGA
jgi:glucose-1-phosphate cytidylyltransferase